MPNTEILLWDSAMEIGETPSPQLIDYRVPKQQHDIKTEKSSHEQQRQQQSQSYLVQTAQGRPYHHQKQRRGNTWRHETREQQRERLIRQLRSELITKSTLFNSQQAKPEVIENSCCSLSFGVCCGCCRRRQNNDTVFVNYSIDENPERGNWSGRLDFLLSCLGFAVGMGNVWRFPYLCFRNGGGAFLVPYILFLLLCGIPMFLLDVGIGQFSSEGPATCWEFAPIFTGIGYAMTYLSTIVSIYYNVIIAISLYYLFASFARDPPWQNCNNTWNTNLCIDRLPVVPCIVANQRPNGTCYDGKNLIGVYNMTQFSKVANLRRILPAEEYFNNEVLKASGNIENFGQPDWKLVLCLLMSWIFIYVCVLQGIKTSGKVVYFTALFPYLLLLILFFRGIFLTNAIEGIRFYIVPDFSMLRRARVWKDAAGQIFFSLSCSWGGFMSLASYNRFHNDIIRDTFFVTLANSGTSIFAGFVIFSFIGHLAGKLNVSVKDVTQDEFGLAFIIYPEAMKLLPRGSYWSIMFFFMILMLGVDSQFGLVETLVTSLCDQFPVLRRHRLTLISFLSIVLFLLGLPFTCPGGMYLLEILDSYAGSWTILLVGLIECLTIGWVYGRPGCGAFFRFSEDISLIVKRPISPIWRYLWQYVTPSLLLFTIFFSWVDYRRMEYTKDKGDYYPVWADIVGWIIAIIPVFIIVGTGLGKILMEPASNSFRKRLRELSIPSYKWGPALPRHRILMAPYLKRLGVLKHFYLDPKRFIKFSDVFPHSFNRNSARTVNGPVSCKG